MGVCKPPKDDAQQANFWRAVACYRCTWRKLAFAGMRLGTHRCFSMIEVHDPMTGSKLPSKKRSQATALQIGYFTLTTRPVRADLKMASAISTAWVALS